MSLWHAIRFGSFSHDLHRGRDKDGNSTEVCTLCGFDRRVLGGETIIGPAHKQKPDVGARTMKAKRVREDNIREWKRSER